MIHIHLVVEVEQYTCKTVLMVTVKTLPSPMSTSKVILQAQTVVLSTGMPEHTMVLLKEQLSSTTQLDVQVVQSSGTVTMVLSDTQNSIITVHWVK